MSNFSYQANQSWFKQLFELSPDPTWIIDGNRFVECNDAAVRTLGYASRQEFLNVHPSRLSPARQADGEDSYSKAERMMAIAREQGLHRFEWLHRKADDSQFLAEVTLSRVEIEGKQLLYCVWRDITERRRTEEALQESELRFRRALEEAPFPIMIHAQDGSVLSINRSWTEITGYALEDIPTLAHWLEKAHGANRETMATQIDAFFSSAVRETKGEFVVRCRDGGTRVWEVSAASIGKLPDGRCIAIRSATDMTERKMMEDQVRQMAFHDNLTKLPNRRLLNDRLGQLMAASQRSGCYAAMLFLDLDNFKLLNDAHGHEVGDLLLIEVANRLKACVREMDTVVRFGGDEFIVILSELDSDKKESAAQAGIVAEKIRLLLSRRYPLTVKQAGKQDSVIEHECTASIGVVLFASHETNRDALLDWADKAMYQAKKSGRNTVRFYHSIT